MKKEEFINQLKKHLYGLEQVEVDEIVRDQEEFIRDAMSSGKKEEEVIQSLGSPQKLSDSLKLEYKIKRIKNADSIWESIREALSSAGILIALMPINLILLFFLIIPVGSFLFSWLMGSVSILFIGISMFFVQFVIWMVMGLPLIHFLAGFFLVLGTIFLGLTGFASLYVFMKLAVRIFVSYIKWNIELIKERK